MKRTAIFVDAGYLFAQGGVALTGNSKKREALILDGPSVVAELKAILNDRCAGSSLLRIYWYDGSAGVGRMSADQALLASLDDVKVRLGFINSNGQQKGVDSLIVTDLIELARLQSIGDAILLSGDEDVRVGVQIAQNYGVRVHLLGVAPSRSNQSTQLLMEADTTTEWDQQKIRRFLSERASSYASAQTKAKVEDQRSITDAAQAPEDFDQNLELAAKEFVDDMQPSEIEALAAYWKSGQRGLPPEFDRRVLPAGRAAIGQDLDNTQKRFVRARVQVFAKARYEQLKPHK